MKKIAQLLCLIAIALVLAYSCSSEYKGYKKSESGAYYKFYEQTANAKIREGDNVTFHLKYSINDTVIFDSDKQPTARVTIPKSKYAGDVYDCFKLMSLGDSASFILEADSFFLITANIPVPSHIKPKSKLYADIKILHLVPREKMEEEKNKYLAKMKEDGIEATKNFMESHSSYSEFIENTGIYFKEITKGSGKQANPTDFISLKYELFNIDNKIIFRTRPTEDFAVECMSKNQHTEGFNLIISKMRKGQKATFFVPSDFAYGETGFSKSILPYFPVIYIIEVTEIRTKEDYIFYRQNKDNLITNTENKKISAFLEANQIKETPRESGLYYIERKEGSGSFVKKGDNVLVHYTLYNLDGKKIDSSVDRGTPLPLKVGVGQVIAGWDEALTLMKVGGKATLILPSKIAYGDRKRSEDILPYTPLHFEVELIEIVKK